MTESKNEIIPLHEKILNSPGVVGLLSFFFMLILNFACLNNPPYWDDILGLHNQAIWLANNNFNLSELWQPGQDYLSGGSNIYRFGIIPYFYGMLYALFSPKTVHILGHLFNMGCLALSFGLSYSILRKFKVINYIALLCCVAALCEPVMSGRIIALGQECPLLCATLLSIYFLLNKKYWLGILFIFTAMLCKMTGGVLATAFVVWLIVCISLAKGKRQEEFKKHYLHLITGMLFICFFLFSSFWWESEQVVLKGNLLLKLFLVLRYELLNFLGIQFIALLMMGILAIYQLIGILKNKKLFDLSEKNKVSLFLLILSGGFWVSYGLCALPLPRYSAFIVFPMYIFVAVNTLSWVKYLNILPMLILLTAGVININGEFYPSLKLWQLRSGEKLERSREFGDDLWANQGACNFLETKCFNRPIIVKWPFVQMLTVPEMGYVNKALPNVYAACPPIKYGKVKAYKAGMKMPNNTLYIFVDNSFAVWRWFGPSLFPARDEKQKIIFANQVRGGRLIIYEKAAR